MTALLRTVYEGPRGPRMAVCDRRCDKAWGINGRRADGATAIEYDQDDDVVYLADHEVGEAPADPGTYEGGHAKPHMPSAHNKWCIRECERSSVIEVGESIRAHDLSHRLYNQPWRHEAAGEHWIDENERFIP